MRTRRQGDTGFTLLELIIVTIMTLVVAASLFGAMIAQQRSYALQIDASDAAQSARAALSIIKAELRMAGWAMSGEARATDLPAVGSCRDPADRFACNNLQDFGGDASTLNDELRIISLVPPRFDDNTDWQAGTPGTHSTTEFPSTDPRPPGIPLNTLAAIDGDCLAPVTGRVTELRVVTADAESVDFRHNYTLAPPPADYPTPKCTDFAPGFSMSMARVVDFFIDRSKTPGPVLFMQVNRGTQDIDDTPSIAQIVAYNIDGLQVEYSIDVGRSVVDPTPDQIGDAWCHDLQNCDLSAVTTSVFAANELAPRAVAVRVGVIPRASVRWDPRETAVRPDFAVFDHTIPGDEYRRWVFRSTVRLRNNELQ